MRTAFDLSSVKEKLKAFRDFNNLVKAIERYEATQSVLKELRDVLETLETISDIQENPEFRKLYSAALTTHALVTYCRACHSKADARFNVGVTKQYTVDQRTKHKTVTDIRDRVIAHHGFPSEQKGKEWATERAVLIITGDKQKKQFVFSRANYLGSVLMDLHELVSVAIPTVEDILRNTDGALDIVAQNHLADSRFQQALTSSPFDPSDFYEGKEIIDLFWTGEKITIEVFRQPEIEEQK